MFLLDTNIVSELRKLRPHGGVVAWFADYPMKAMAIPSIVIYELQAGAERTRRQDERKAAELDRWIAAIPTQIAVLPFGTEEARTTSRFLRGKSLDLMPDAMIAATASSYGLTVITRNVRHFERFPVRLHNPFSGKSVL